MRLLVCTLLAVTGCTVPDVDNNWFRCATDYDCGAGWVCRWYPGAPHGVCQVAASAVEDGGENGGDGDNDDGWDGGGALPCEVDGECPTLPAGGCMESVCQMGACVKQARAAGAACDDGDACTVDDGCKDGACKGAPKVCDDNNPCTDNYCSKISGCWYYPTNINCDDGNPCTDPDVCEGGTCQGSTKTCDDGNPCTTNECDTNEGCQHTAKIGGACDDGDACTVGDMCISGTCLVSGELGCDDGNPCTSDSCDSHAGCTHVNNEKPCDDGNACTMSDGCINGKCVSTTPLDCNDDNPCTDDACQPQEGCVRSNNDKACNDGDACTFGDKCSGGVCEAGSPTNCNDGNLCTDDACESQKGCSHSNNVKACNDGSACTVGDKCSGGVCKAGTAANCNDGDPCTADTCLASSGCKQTMIDGCMVDVPAGTFWMGCNAVVDLDCDTNEKPQHQVTVSAYQIDKTEVTVVAWGACVAAGGCTAPGTESIYCNWNKSGKEQHPVNCVTWTQASAFCAWKGKRLCTEAEWEKAARGGCEKYPGQTCSAAMSKYPWGNAAASCSYAVMDSGGDGCGTGSTWAVGSKPAGASPYGALDMAGNVWEWVSDWYGAGYYYNSPTSNPLGLSSGSYRVTRGGSYNHGGYYLRASIRFHDEPSGSYDVLGLRCCRSVE